MTIADTTAGATIYYTTDGTNPTITSQVFNPATPISVSKQGQTQIRALAAATGFAEQPRFEHSSSTIDARGRASIAPPTASPNSGTQNNTLNVALTDDDRDRHGLLHDGRRQQPVVHRRRLRGWLCPVQRCDSGSGHGGQYDDQGDRLQGRLGATSSNSVVLHVRPHGRQRDVANPPPPGNFNGPTSVTLSTATQNATIHYTTDGTTVATCGNGTTATNTASVTVYGQHVDQRRCLPDGIHGFVCRADLRVRRQHCGSDLRDRSTDNAQQNGNDP